MTKKLTAFTESNCLTMGIELELQLLNLQHYDLAMEAQDFLRRVSDISHPGEIKPEITQAMIEINSSVHKNFDTLLQELETIRNVLVEQACQAHIGICGGGAHSFQKWREQRIFQTERFASISEQYGYLAKQFTVFGQHIHIACPNGDDALYICHALARYIPHFIALSASSPFHQGVDTSFDCSRLTIISAFPLSGTPPWLLKWSEFEDYFEKMEKLELVTSIKDFYWDVRPKPEFGTVELRICDTPLTIKKAAELAAFAQALVCYLLEHRPVISREIYLSYFINRFRAARYGLEAVLIDPVQHTHLQLADDIIKTCSELEPYATRLGSVNALNQIKFYANTRKNDAFLLRQQYARLQSLNDTVRKQAKFWAAEN